MNISIRPSEPSDAKCLKEWLLEPGILDFFPVMDVRELDDTIRIWMSYGAKEATLTADFDGMPAGMLVLYLQPYEKLKHQCLFGIVVGKEFRGKGVGTMLIKEAERMAKKKHGIELLHLEVYKGNPAQ
ncbi:MAG: GNAT family N-acetyltransferase, partial [Chlamydiia bacterium]|nr:GNAT family N-acetyltransferase [Chlamydiia bacterium]